MTGLARRTTSQIRVRYAETDAQGVAYHANFLVWFEVARGDYLRAIGFDYNRMEAEGAFVVVAEAHTKYLSPACYDEELTVTAWISELRTRSFRFEYEVSKGDRLVATGWTAHVVINRDRRPIQIPEPLRAAVENPQEPFRGDAVISPVA